MIFQTAEIRWFHPGNIPGEIEKWFTSLDGQFEEQPPRTDRYLKLNGSNTLGIKIREGRFEIKENQSREKKFLSINKIEGFAELWTKWSFESFENKYHLNKLIKGEFIAINKIRALQKYIFDSNGNIESGFDNFNSDGCNLELTIVSVNNSNWWTLGLETYGRIGLFEDNLKTAFYQIFKERFPGNLSRSNSFSYPKWLMSLEIHNFFQ